MKKRSKKAKITEAIEKNIPVELNSSRERLSPREKEEAFRKTRKKFTGERLKLSIPDVPGYHLHWFKDTPGRLQNMLERGYQFVDSERNPIGVGEDPRGTDSFGTLITHIDKTGVKLYLMAIRQEWYDEDQKVKEAERNEVKKAIQRGKFQLGSEPNKTYVPDGGIQVSRGKGD